MQQSYQCSNCGAPVASGVRFCGNCGARLAVGAKGGRGTSPWLRILVVFIAVVFFFGGIPIALGTCSPATTSPPSLPTSVPVINSFTANPTSINEGDSCTLAWDVTGAAAVAIDNGIGAVPASGDIETRPSTTTTYTLIAATTGRVTKSVTVTVTASPNTGAVKGHISYFDNVPASQMEVVFFEQDNITSYKRVTTDNNGDYTLSNVPVGTYEIYTATFRHDSPVVLTFGTPPPLTTEELLPPDAIISISDQQIVTPPTIMVPRQITHIYYHDTNHSSLVDITDPTLNVTIASASMFSWVTIPNAANYSVLFRPLNYQPANYNDSITVKGATITSPILQPYNYVLIIQAFDERGARVGEGRGWFNAK